MGGSIKLSSAGASVETLPFESRGTLSSVEAASNVTIGDSTMR